MVSAFQVSDTDAGSPRPREAPATLPGFARTRSSCAGSVKLLLRVDVDIGTLASIAPWPPFAEDVFCFSIKLLTECVSLNFITICADYDICWYRYHLVYKQ